MLFATYGPGPITIVRLCPTVPQGDRIGGLPGNEVGSLHVGSVSSRTSDTRQRNRGAAAHDRPSKNGVPQRVAQRVAQQRTRRTSSARPRRIPEQQRRRTPIPERARQAARGKPTERDSGCADERY